MTTESQELVQNVQRTYPTSRHYFTPHGEALFQEDPDLFAAFVCNSYEMACLQTKAAGMEWIDRGRTAHVFTMPNYPELCLKVTAKHTLRKCMKMPNLVAEAKIMHAVGERLRERPESLVDAPRQYAVVRFAGASVLLQERVPEEFQSMSKLKEGKKTYPDEETYRNHAQLVLRRFSRAIGLSVLRLGLTDLKGNMNMVNTGNFMVEKDKAADESRIYAIDLVGNRLRQTAVASALGALLA